VRQELGLCEHCTLDTYCHVVEYPSGRKYSTALFHDAVKPAWEIDQLV
jgi:hypothetical protein